MKMFIRFVTAATILAGLLLVSGCEEEDEMTESMVTEIAQREAKKLLDEYKQSFKPETYGFGVPWEKDFSYAQGVKVGNMIYVAGQLSHSQEKDVTWEYGKVTVGEDFETQFRQTLENIKAVLEHFGGSMDDVVFLQSFFDPEAGGKTIGNAGPVVKKLINEYFPKAQHAMTNMQIANLFGENQFVETNAIAVVRE
ncbi:RidA family protein [Candidatus Latescibacterota bacterium]